MNSVVNFKEYRTKFGLYEGAHVPLEEPMIEAPELNKPKRSGGPSKYVVYVKNPKTGNVMKINFGDKKGGLTSKINDREAARNFASRHNCDTKTDKTKAGYWACRLPKYAKSLGLKGGGNYFW
jgi:hypothetical protein